MGSDISHIKMQYLLTENKEKARDLLHDLFKQKNYGCMLMVSPGTQTGNICKIGPLFIVVKDRCFHIK